MDRVQEIAGYWRDHYGCSLSNSDIDFLLARVRELEEGIEEWHASKQKDWTQFTLYDDRLYALLKGEE